MISSLSNVRSEKKDLARSRKVRRSCSGCMLRRALADLCAVAEMIFPGTHIERSLAVYFRMGKTHLVVSGRVVRVDEVSVPRLRPLRVKRRLLPIRPKEATE